MSTKSEEAGQVSVSAVIGIVIIVAIVSGSLAYISAPTGTSKEDVKSYLETASDKDIKEVLATISGELLNEIASERFPLTIEDDRGEEITIPEKPERIVSLHPAGTETLFALHLDNLVVGVTTYCNYPPRVENMKEEGRLVEVGGYTTFSVEKVVGLNPDLVLAGQYKAMPKDRIQSLEGVGLKVICLEAENVWDAIGEIQLIGRACGSVSRAEEIAENMSEEINSVIERTQELPEDEWPKVFWESWWEPIYTSGSGTFVDEIIEISGGRNIFSDLESWIVVSREAIVERNPEVYIISPMGGRPRTAGDVEEEPGFGGLDAVAENRVYKVHPDIFSRPGPRLVDAAKVLAYYLHPGLFEKPTLPYAEVEDIAG